MMPPTVLVLNIGTDLRDAFPRVLQKAFAVGRGTVPYSTYRKAVEHLPLRPDTNAFQMVVVDVGSDDPPFDPTSPATVPEWIENGILSKAKKAVFLVLCPATAQNEWKTAIVKTRQEFYDVVPRTHAEDDLVAAVKEALEKPQRNIRKSRLEEWTERVADPRR